MIDSKVISAVMQGDPQAFEKVYLQTHDKAYSIAYRVLKDDYEAEDIVQEAYIKMIEQVSQLENPEKLESWFYRIVQNKALDFLRTSHNDTFSSFESEDTDFSFSDTLVSDYTPFDPEASADYAELKRIMDGFVKELPEMQRKCIILRFQGDKKISEIAQILGIPESTVKSNLNYGKKKIEGEVRALEKQGVKLYSLSPLTVIAFLRWMWGKSAASAVSAGIGSAGAATGAAAAVSATAGGTSSASAAAGSAAAGTAAKTGAAIGAKQIIAGVCAAAVIGGGVAGILLHQPEKQLEKLVTVQSEAIYEEFVPHSYCLPQISDEEHDWSELNHQLQLSYDQWAEAWDYNCEHQETYKQYYDGADETFLQELWKGKHPEQTDLRFTFSLASPFLEVGWGTEYWSAARNIYSDEPLTLSYEEAVKKMNYNPGSHAYSIETGLPVTHTDMMKYLNLSEADYIQMLHDSLDAVCNQQVDDLVGKIPDEELAFFRMEAEEQREIGHRLIGSDCITWKNPQIQLSDDSFIITLYDDDYYERIVSNMIQPHTPTPRGSNFVSVSIPFGKVEITETAIFEYGKK